jgi:hypothetical protein
MSLDLHAQCIERLTEVIATGLDGVTVENQMFLSFRAALSLSKADDVLPQSGKLRATLQEYLSETPVFDFAVETLARELSETQKYDPDKPAMKLMEMTGYEDLRIVATRLVEEFRSLPWQYALSLSPPNEIGLVLAKATQSLTSNALRIVTPDDVFSAEYPLQSGIEARDRALAPSLSDQFLDHRSLNIDTFNPMYVLMGHALPEEAPARPVQRAGHAQTGVHSQV